jgi:hypothetical protein
MRAQRGHDADDVARQLEQRCRDQLRGPEGALDIRLTAEIGLLLRDVLDLEPSNPFVAAPVRVANEFVNLYTSSNPQ